MKALQVIGIILLILIVLFFVIAAFLPGDFKVEKSVTINSSVECPFNQVNDLSNWVYWSPFDDDDSTMVTTYEGPAAGFGAKSMWTSEKQGNGSMIISESTPFEKIVTDLDFGPQGTALGWFTFDEVEGGTTVTWGMETEASYPVERFIYAIIKGMMEETFEQGLNSLKAHCEDMSLVTSELSFIRIEKSNSKEAPKTKSSKESPHLYVLNLVPRWIATIKDSCSMDEISGKMGQGFGELMEYVKSMGHEENGNPFTIWHKWDLENQFGVFEMGVSIGAPVPDEGRITVRKFEPTKVVGGIHYGSYSQTLYMYEAISKYVKDHNMEEVGGPIEVYVKDPSQVEDDSQLETLIIFPVK